MNKRYKKWIVRSIVVIIVIVFLSWPHYMITSQTGDITVVRHKDELFISINRETDGWHGSMLQELHLALISYLGSSNNFRGDLILWHLKDGHLRRYFFGNTGGPGFAYNGNLYFGISSEHAQAPIKERENVYANFCYWNGNGLTKLDKKANDNINQIIDQGAFFNGSFQKGWEEISVDGIANDPVKKTKIALGSREYAVILRQESDLHKKPFWRTYSLSGPGVAKPEQLLYSYKIEAQNVSSKVYWTYFGTDTSALPYN